jgi:hypothetical protein
MSKRKTGGRSSQPVPQPRPSLFHLVLRRRPRTPRSRVMFFITAFTLASVAAFCVGTRWAALARPIGWTTCVVLALTIVGFLIYSSTRVASEGEWKFRLTLCLPLLGMAILTGAQALTATATTGVVSPPAISQATPSVPSTAPTSVVTFSPSQSTAVPSASAIGTSSASTSASAVPSFFLPPPGTPTGQPRPNSTAIATPSLPTPTPPAPSPTPSPTVHPVTQYNCDYTPKYLTESIPQSHYWSMDIYPSGQYIDGGKIHLEGTGEASVGIYNTQGTSDPVGPQANFGVNGFNYYSFTFPNPIKVTPGARYYFVVSTISGNNIAAHDNPNELGVCIIGSLSGYSVY